MITKEQAMNIKGLIEQYDNIVLFHHTNPDGDCMATSFGLARALRDNYPNKNIKVVADIEDFTPYLRYMDEYVEWDKTITSPEHNNYLAIIGDVSGKDRIRFYDDFIDSIEKVICYDHHENELNVDKVVEFWKQAKYPAAGIMAYEMCEAMGLKVEPTAALIMNHGIITDTGSFKFAPGDRHTFEVSGKLNEIIGREAQVELIQKMGVRTINDIKFQGWVLENFKIANDNVAYICITEEDLKRFNYKPMQGAKVFLLAGIEGIESWLFFIQYPDFVRVEFRSYHIHVDKIANEFGGGGHNNASGAKLEKMEEHQKVVDRVVEVVKESGY